MLSLYAQVPGVNYMMCCAVASCIIANQILINNKYIYVLIEIINLCVLNIP